MSGWVIIDQSTYREVVSVFKSKMHRSLGSGSTPAQASKERKYVSLCHLGQHLQQQQQNSSLYLVGNSFFM